jgi:hypothetical protein
MGQYASSAFKDVSPLTFDVRLAFDDLSARISLAGPVIFPSNSCRSDSRVLSCEVAASGSGLVSIVRRPISCGFEVVGSALSKTLLQGLTPSFIRYSIDSQLGTNISRTEG